MKFKYLRRIWQRLNSNMFDLVRGTYIAEANVRMLAHEKLDDLQESMVFKRTSEFVRALTPKNVKGISYVRVGKDFDGGYVMADHFSKVEAAYSFGIGIDASWDLSIGKRGIPVHMYDHTISKCPVNHPQLHFRKVGLAGSNKKANCRTLSQFLEENGHSHSTNLILKMDVEGMEWNVFANTPKSDLERFSQIAVEFHGLTPFLPESRFQSMLDSLNRLNETHQVVHVHANATGVPFVIGNMVLPRLLEVTYLRRADFEERFLPNDRYFPTELDHPTFPGSPDIFLGKFEVRA